MATLLTRVQKHNIVKDLFFNKTLKISASFVNYIYFTTLKFVLGLEHGLTVKSSISNFDRIFFVSLSLNKEKGGEITKTVKSVVGEEIQLKLAEERLSQSGDSLQVGLVIGKLSSKLDRGFVFDLIQTPPNDAGEPACSFIETSGANSSSKNKKGSVKSQSDYSYSLLTIDKDWVAEHARQVSRMLLGGVKVIGIYIWTVKGVAEAAQFMDNDESLLIHISYSPRSLRPCDFKMGRVLTSLQTFRCRYSFDRRLPICRENRSNIRSLTDILRHGISSHAQVLKGAKALIDGKLVTEAEHCALDGLHEVEFLLPFMQDTAVEACSQKEVVGVLVLSGSVYSFTYINSKEPISQALADLKGDIVTSLLSRLDIICDEEDTVSDSNSDGGAESSTEMSTKKFVPQLELQVLRKQSSLTFPRRVFIPWLAGTYICDYIHPSETLEVLKDHCIELMSVEAPTDASAILEPETEAPTLGTMTTKSFWDVVIPYTEDSKPPLSVKSIVNSSPGSEKKSKAADNFNIMAVVLTLIVSIIVGLALLFFRVS